MTPFEYGELRAEVLHLWHRLAARGFYPGAANIAARLESGWSARAIDRVLADLEAEGLISWDDVPPPPTAAAGKVGLAGHTAAERREIAALWVAVRRAKIEAIEDVNSREETGPRRHRRRV